MYKQVNECVKAENAAVKSQKKMNHKKFNQFVEVEADNGQTIFIHKTTALWLLQEGERISADRLFRVRCKQPYASSMSSITNNGNIKPITIVDDQVKDQVMSIPQDIPTSSAAITEVKGDCNALKSWLKIGTIALHDTDKQIILNGKWLWGTHLTAVQLILKSQFFNINGLEDTALVLRKGNTIITESIQILHVNGNHWITIPTLDSVNSNCDVTIYDSLHFSLSQDTKMLLATLLKTNKKSLVVKFANTHKQAGMQ